MLSDNIRILRKQKGYTQEELAIRLHVVRQTVSKWEKGLSVPDADTLQRLAELLEVEVRQLLGSGVDMEKGNSEVTEQLARINEQLAIKNRRTRRIWKTVGIILLVLLIFNILAIVANFAAFESLSTEMAVQEASEVIISEP
ncbi:MAG: helix-turn-helix transcriptional regulator [Lachnospiraceae bacterium]|nr:helix-turn-helix transcriptional regulator [Lachnospiraceae bacterium]